MRDISIDSNLDPLTNSAATAGAPSLKISSHIEFEQKSMETETTACSEFANGRKATMEKILGSEKRNKSKRLWEPQSGMRERNLTI